MLYNNDIKNGAHVVYYREKLPKIKGTFNRLCKEAEIVSEVANFINGKLKDKYIRKDLTLDEI